jgi:MATE family multidrug resistance protein
LSAAPAVTTARVFAIAGPAMLANLTTPFLGLVATAAVGRLGEPHLLGGVAMASVVFDCMFWLFGFLRMGTVALTAQAVGARELSTDAGASAALEIRAVLLRALTLSALIGFTLLALQIPLATSIFSLIGGSEAVSSAARSYFAIRLWSAPFVLGNYVLVGWLVGQARTGVALALQIVINAVNMAMTVWLVLGLNRGIEGAATAAVLAEGVGFTAGAIVAWRMLGGQLSVAAGVLFDRAKLLRMLAINRDIMIRTAALIAAFLFFTAQGARGGDETLAANAVLHNFLLISAFFLDGLANAAEQLCGQTMGARDRTGFSDATRLILWGFASALLVTAAYGLFGGALIDVMTTIPGVRDDARKYLWLVVLAPLLGVFAFAYDGVFIGATWARDMRNLMILSLIIFLVAWFCLRPFGNTGLWGALLVHYAARGGLQALRYPALLRTSFKEI